MRAEALLLAALALPARAGDLGESLSFDAPLPRSASAAGVIYDTGDAASSSGEWDTLLVDGVLPEGTVRLEARRSGGGSAWTAMTVRRHPGGRFWARAVFAPGAGGARVRVIDEGVQPGRELELYGAQVYSSADSKEAAPEAEPVARPPSDPTAPPPTHHPRARWGAAPPKEPYSPDPLPWRMTLHHTDGRRTTTLAESLAEARFIQDFHQNGRGWSDIGYHFLVDSAGNIIEGRPMGALGAHTLNNNEGNVGVVLMGRHHPPKNETVAPAALDAVTAIGRWLVARWGLEPDSLKGHRDYKHTDCPGDKAYPQLPGLIARIGQAAQASTAKPSRTR